VRAVLGKSSPDELAARLVAGTKLKDVAVRRALWDGGARAIAASDDPMIALARSIDRVARAARHDFEQQVEAPFKENGERIAKARFAIEGTSTYPDATFTLRLSYGSVEGWREPGKAVAPFTTFAGAFDRATERAPFALPPSWLRARPRLALATPFNFCTSNDIIGGNSGSPVIDRDARVVGVIFDGNLPSLGGDYGFDPATNRAVALDSAAIIEGLRKIYDAPALVRELLDGHR
jgi:hypothetical protein